MEVCFRDFEPLRSELFDMGGRARTETQCSESGAFDVAPSIDQFCVLQYSSNNFAHNTGCRMSDSIIKFTAGTVNRFIEMMDGSSGS